MALRRVRIGHVLFTLHMATRLLSRYPTVGSGSLQGSEQERVRVLLHPAHRPANVSVISPAQIVSSDCHSGIFASECTFVHLSESSSADVGHVIRSASFKWSHIWDEGPRVV
jgi:hypothetical protein